MKILAGPCIRIIWKIHPPDKWEKKKNAEWTPPRHLSQVPQVTPRLRMPGLELNAASAKQPQPWVGNIFIRGKGDTSLPSRCGCDRLSWWETGSELPSPMPFAQESVEVLSWLSSVGSGSQKAKGRSYFIYSNLLIRRCLSEQLITKPIAWVFMALIYQ